MQNFMSFESLLAEKMKITVEKCDPESRADSFCWRQPDLTPEILKKKVEHKNGCILYFICVALSQHKESIWKVILEENWVKNLIFTLGISQF